MAGCLGRTPESLKASGRSSEKVSLSILQGKIKRDPEGYETELQLIYKQFKASVDLFQQQAALSFSSVGGIGSDPSVAKDLGDRAMFLAHVTPFYPKQLAQYPKELTDFLRTSCLAMPSGLRNCVAQALILLMNRKSLVIEDLMALFLDIQTLGDKNLRNLAFSHIVQTIRKMSSTDPKHKALQKIVISMLEQEDETKAKRALVTLCELHKRNTWPGDKNDRVAIAICEACFYTSPRGIVLEPRCPKSVDGISIDPEPNWNFDSLVSEIESVEKKLNAFSKFPQPFTKTTLGMRRSGGGFVMRVSEDDMESDEDEESDEEEVEDHSQICTSGKRFACDELYLSDESDDEFDGEPESFLMNKMGLAESALYEVINDHQTEIKEDIRNQVSVVETEIMNEVETSRSAIARVEKYSETRKEVERKLDLQYQRKVAEALDTHLTAVQREHEIKSQIEERKIRSEEAQEEARKRERALQEEKIRQEKARQEAEMLAKIRAEEAKKEVERKAAKELAEKEAADRRAAEQKLAEEKAVIERASVAGSSATPTAHAGGKLIQGAESALTLEKHRLKKLEELEAMNQSLKSRSNQDFSSFENHIGRVLRQITGVKDNVSAKINDILKIFKDPRCPVSISIATFAKKMVSSTRNPFACSYVIVYITSQFPEAMDIILAEFHKACTYTVPKHIVNSQSALDSDAFERLGSIMRLYGALVQTDVRSANATNIHGIEHGWAWLARFLNKISTKNRATATALNAFLQTAGFGLHQRYKSQFVKVLNIIREHFLEKLKAKKDTSDLALVIADITAYLDDRMYLKEPEGRTLQTTSLLSKEITDELDQQNYNQHYQRNYYRDY